MWDDGVKTVLTGGPFGVWPTGGFVKNDVKIRAEVWWRRVDGGLGSLLRQILP